MLHCGTRTWSLMMLERARVCKQFSWRKGDDSIKKHVQKMKDLYYEIWRRIGSQCHAGHSYEAALEEVSVRPAVPG